MRGMNVARFICNTNAKPAIKTEERVMRKQNSAYSLFSVFSVIFYSPTNSRSEYRSVQDEYHCEAIELAADK